MLQRCPWPFKTLIFKLSFFTLFLSQFVLNGIYALRHGRPTFYGKGPHPLLRVGSWVAHVKIIISGIPNCLKYYVIFFNLLKPSGFFTFHKV